MRQPLKLTFIRCQANKKNNSYSKFGNDFNNCYCIIVLYRSCRIGAVELLAHYMAYLIGLCQNPPNKSVWITPPGELYYSNV